MRRSEPEGETTLYDPRPREDKTRRTIAYLHIATLVAVVLALLAMVVFDVIAVSDIKEFGVILGLFVTPVSVITGFYFAARRSERAAPGKQPSPEPRSQKSAPRDRRS